MKSSLLFFSILSICLVQHAYAQNDTVKIMQYNLLSFGQPCGSVVTSDKYDWLGDILEHAQPDILAVNELGPNAVLGNGIVQLSFGYTNNISQADMTNEAGSNFVNHLFYRDDKFGYSGVEVINGIVRDINVYKLYPLASAQAGDADTVFFYCIVAHFKAGGTTSDQTQRNNAANNIIAWVGQHPEADNILLMGDFNIGSANQTAFQNLINPNNPEHRFLDPINKQNGWGGASNAIHHTQSTRSSFIDCGSNGGMDDRFDMILTSEAVINGTSNMQYVPDSYHAFGNDGNSYNTALGCTGNTTVPTNICSRLQLMSDHLPVIADFAFNLSTSIENEMIPDLEVSVSPNPMKDVLTVSLQEGQASAQEFKLQILDIQGRSLLQTSGNSSELFRLQTSELASGLYFLQIEDRKGRHLHKKIVKH